MIGWDQILQSLSFPKGQSLPFWEMMIRLSFATFSGFYITFVSYIFYTGKYFQNNIAHAQILLTVVCAMIINVIGQNVAWAIGLIGALSFIRFRTSLKDPKDTAIFFNSIAVGIASGAGEFTLAGCGMFLLTIILAIFKIFPFFQNEPFLLKIQGTTHLEMEENEKILKNLNIRYMVLESSSRKDNLLFRIFLSRNKVTEYIHTFRTRFESRFISLVKEEIEV